METKTKKKLTWAGITYSAYLLVATVIGGSMHPTKIEDTAATLVKAFQKNTGKIREGRCAYADPTKPLTFIYNDFKTTSPSFMGFKAALTFTALRPTRYEIAQTTGFSVAPCDVLLPEKRIAAADFEKAVQKIADDLVKDPAYVEMTKEISNTTGLVGLVPPSKNSFLRRNGLRIKP